MRWPPTASISSAMASALRRLVPLNAMCSRKCATPLISAGSCRVPTSTQMPSETVSTVSIRSVAICNPFARAGDPYRHAAAPARRARARMKRFTASKSFASTVIRSRFSNSSPSAGGCVGRIPVARSTASGNLAG